ncbi:hypothetical protein [Bradyrhizobium sp. UFLA05-112]
MAEFLIFSFLVGAVLGQRFRVLVLLPLTLAIGLIAIPIGMIAQIAFLEGLKDFALCATALQGGYLFGSLARFWLAAARASRVFVRPLKTAR